LIVAALLAVVGCGGGTATMDGGTGGAGGRGGTSAAGGRGGASSGGGATGAAGSAGTTGAGGSGAAGTGGASGAAGAGGTTGTAGAGGTAGAAGRGGAGAASGAGGTAGRGGGGGGGGATAGAAGIGGAAGRGGTGGSAGTGGGAGRGGAGGVAGAAGGGGGTAGIAGGGGGGAGGGTACTTTSGCTSAQYCDISNNRCAANAGTCKARPQGCTADVDPVCGCDGVVYSNTCMAAAAGTDISDLGGCTPPTGTFPCGPRFCTHGTQYCEGKTGGAATNPGDYACHTLPAGCGGTPTCACISGSAMCGNCTMSNNGDIMTSCLFP